MKIFPIALTIVLASINILGQENTPKLKLYSEIVSVKAREAKDNKGVVTSDVLDLIVKFTLKNESDRDIILLQHRPEIVREGLLHKAEGDEPFAQTVNLGYPDLMTNKKWRGLAAGLDKASPPPAKILHLSPQDSIVFAEVLSMEFLRNFSGSWSVTSYKYNFNLRSFSRFYLQWEMETWVTDAPYHKRNAPSQQKALEIKLRKKWDKFGYLYTGKIDSVPVLLDLDETLKIKLQIKLQTSMTPGMRGE